MSARRIPHVLPTTFQPPGFEKLALVDYDVEARPSRRRFSHEPTCRLSLRYYAVPRDRFAEIQALGLPRKALRAHPATIAVRSHVDVDESAHLASFTEALRSDGADFLVPRAERRRTHCVAVDPLSDGAVLEHFVDLLRDPLEYHWGPLRRLILAGLAALASQEPAPRPSWVNDWLTHLLGFISTAFAAKWLLNAEGNRLGPDPNSFEYPRDARFLIALLGHDNRYSLGMWTATLASAGIQSSALGRYLSGKQALPLSDEFGVDLFAVAPRRCFEEGAFSTFIVARMKDRASNDLGLRRELSSSAIVEYLLDVFEEFPLPGRVTDLDTLVRLFGGDLLTFGVPESLTQGLHPAVLLGNVWVDRYSPASLRQDLAFAVPTLRASIEQYVESPWTVVWPNEAVHMALDLVVKLRRFVRETLQQALGPEWLYDSSLDKVRERVFSVAHIRRVPPSADHLELADIEECLSKHWGATYEPFFRSLYATYFNASTPRKDELIGWIGRFSDIRNRIAHRDAQRLSVEEAQVIRQRDDQVSLWLTHASAWSPAGRLPETGDEV